MLCDWPRLQLMMKTIITHYIRTGLVLVPVKKIGCQLLFNIMEALYKKDVYQSHVVSQKDQKLSPGNLIYHGLENRCADFFKITFLLND